MTDEPFRPAPWPVLALDLGASRIRAAVVLPDGSLASRADGITRGAAGPEAVIADCIDLLNRVRSATPATTATAIGGLGISAPGPVVPATGLIVEPPNMPAFRDVPFAEPVGRAVGLPAALDRDTNVAMLGELVFGAARGARHVIYLTVSTGLGGAIVADGRLVTGPDGVAGELGHLVVDLDGPPCGCGDRGHLESFSSGTAIVRAAREALDAGAAPGLASAMGAITPAQVTARDVAAAEDAGDPTATRIMASARRAFASALVGIVNVFAPELIVVGGSLARSQGDRWLDPARDAVRARAFRIPAARVRIVPADLGDDVGLVGASVLVGTRLADARPA
jgi:glucokinase